MGRSQEFASGHGISYDEFDARLEQSIGLKRGGEGQGKRTIHPLSGFSVRVGRSRQLIEGSSPPMVQTLEHGHIDPVIQRRDSGLAGPQKVSQAPLKHVYRAISEDEFADIGKKGVVQSDQRGNICQTEGTCAMGLRSPQSYLPNTGTGRILKIRVHPDDGWHVDTDGYVKTMKPVPADRIVRHTPKITRKDTRIVGWGG